MATHKEALERAVIKWFDGNKSFVEEWHSEQLEAAIRAYLDARGLVMVPREPTPEMVVAARLDHEGEAYLPYSLYASMLAAAPNPFKDEDNDR